MKENIEEDMKKISNLIEYIENADYVDASQCFDTEDISAIEHILSEYKRVLKKNEELKLDKLEMQKTIKEMAKHIEKYCTSFPENYGANAEEWEKYFRERCK